LPSEIRHASSASACTAAAGRSAATILASSPTSLTVSGCSVAGETRWSACQALRTAASSAGQRRRSCGSRQARGATPLPQNTQQPLGLYKQTFWADEFGQAMVVPASTAQSAPISQWCQAGSKPYYFSCEE
jgi:hypothetical protein